MICKAVKRSARQRLISTNQRRHSQNSVARTRRPRLPSERIHALLRNQMNFEKFCDNLTWL